MESVNASLLNADEAGIRSRAGDRFNRFEVVDSGGDVRAPVAGNGEDDPPRSIIAAVPGSLCRNSIDARPYASRGKGEYARAGNHVNTVEGWFGILKRSIKSTHIAVSAKHLPKYLAEFGFRQNLRKVPHLIS